MSVVYTVQFLREAVSFATTDKVSVAAETQMFIRKVCFEASCDFQIY